MERLGKIDMSLTTGMLIGMLSSTPAGGAEPTFPSAHPYLALAPEDIDEEVFASALGTAGIPDPDLLIRTSGEMRLSNFLLWQLAYTEIYVTDTLWPDFREPELLLALEDYKRRQRRFGRTTEQLAQEA